MDLLERLEWVLTERGWNQREWGRRAGLRDSSHLGTVMTRIRSGGGGRVSITTLARLAEAAGVSLDWLALGRGSPLLPPEAEPDIYPNRAKALVCAVVMGLPEQALEAVRAINGLPVDPDPVWWVQQIAAAARSAPPDRQEPVELPTKRHR